MRALSLSSLASLPPAAVRVVKRKEVRRRGGSVDGRFEFGSRSPLGQGTGFAGFIGWCGRPCQQVITCLSAVCYCCDSDATLSTFTIVAVFNLSTMDCFLLSVYVV